MWLAEMLDYIETEGNWKANCQFPLTLPEIQGESIGDKGRVTGFCLGKGPGVQICGLRGGK
jgi:hypothetical protein